VIYALRPTPPEKAILDFRRLWLLFQGRKLSYRVSKDAVHSVIPLMSGSHRQSEGSSTASVDSASSSRQEQWTNGIEQALICRFCHARWKRCFDYSKGDIDLPANSCRVRSFSFGFRMAAADWIAWDARFHKAILTRNLCILSGIDRKVSF
jgi:hypothetical protein